MDAEEERAIALLSLASAVLISTRAGSPPPPAMDTYLAAASSSVVPMLITFFLAVNAVHGRVAAIDPPPLRGVAALEQLVVTAVAIAAAMSLFM